MNWKNLWRASSIRCMRRPKGMSTAGGGPRTPRRSVTEFVCCDPRGGGCKISSWWLGPYRVTEQLGQASFWVQIPPGIFQDVHLDQVKPCLVDKVLVIGRPLTYRRDEGEVGPPP